MDLRVEKTERAIKNAFLQLRSKNPLEKITVKEMCEKAYINKSTFYAHYQDIYALSDVMEEEMVNNITHSIAHPEIFMKDPGQFTEELVLAYFAQKNLMDIMFSGNQRNHLADKIEKGVEQLIFDNNPELLQYREAKLYLRYCIQGTYCAVRDNKDLDISEVIQIIAEVNTNVCRYLIEKYL